MQEMGVALRGPMEQNVWQTQTKFGMQGKGQFQDLRPWTLLLVLLLYHGMVVFSIFGIAPVESEGTKVNEFLPLVPNFPCIVMGHADIHQKLQQQKSPHCNPIGY